MGRHNFHVSAFFVKFIGEDPMEAQELFHQNRGFLTMTLSATELKVLLVGNNPREIRDIYYRIRNFKSPIFQASIAFHLRKIFRRIRKIRPASILIDDRLNRKRLTRLLKRLQRNPNTREIPVTILKSSNKDLRLGVYADDYLLKENMTADNLRMSILNSHQLRLTNIYLYKSYKRSRNFLQKIWLDLSQRV